MYCYSPLAYALAVMAVAGVIRSWSLLSRAKALAQTVADFCLTSSARVALVLGRFQRLQHLQRACPAHRLAGCVLPCLPWPGCRGVTGTSPRSSSGVLLRSELPLEWAVTHVDPSVVGVAVGPAVQPVDDAVGDVGDRADDVQVDVTLREHGP